MRVDNRTDISFGIVSISDNAIKSLAKRLPINKFATGVPRIINNHRNNPIKILVDTKKNSNRLVCKVSIPKKNSEELLYEYSDKENILDRIFSNPIDFLKDVCKHANDIACYLGHRN